jgi:trans-aconitate methyltransferase
MTTQTWNAADYAKNARFVSDLGMPVLELLAPKPGEHILDLGCGDGVLTKKIAERGCKVLGIDASADFVVCARRLGLDVVEMNVYDMEFGPHFDAAFSNAALHWMQDPDAVIRRVARALRPNGRFVAEMGGHGNVRVIHCALIEELNSRGYDGEAARPWYMPTPGDYGARLSAGGFKVNYIALIPRPTSLPGDVMSWLTTFAGSFTGVLPAAERQEYLACVRERIRPQLCNAQGDWTADYVRLRFEAHLLSSR